MNAKIREQILAIRDTGATNMFDKITVQRMATELGYYELVGFLEEKTKEYIQFILTGESEEQYNEATQSAAFVRKAYTLDDLISWDKEAKQRSKYIIEKTIVIPKSEYKELCGDLISDRKVVEDNIGLMYMDKNKNQHCILVKEEGSTEGILIQCEGFSYPRYAAYYKE